MITHYPADNFPPSGHVSLRATAADTAGNTVRQTIRNACILR